MYFIRLIVSHLVTSPAPDKYEIAVRLSHNLAE